MRSQQLGANIQQTLVLQGAGSLRDSVYKNVFQPFKTDLLRLASIRSVTASSSVMGQEIYWTNGVLLVGSEKKNAVTLYNLGIDYDFLPAFQVHLVAGRNFSREFGTDRKAVLINERAMEVLGFRSPDEALHSRIVREDTLTIIGVVSNFHQEGLQKTIEPILILLRPEIRDYYSVKIGASADLQKTIAYIENAWNKYFPADPFHYFFLDESFNAQYKSDIRFGKVFGMFAFLAILIACFGLLGLSAYNVSQRTKEIGIRKVLGASERGLLVLLSKDFLYLVLCSLILAIPLAWWVMDVWLMDFAYRISIQWWVFLFSGCLAVLIALLTVSVQALRAASSNPVVSLRTE
jgi:putative ABC transport system permease protein